MTLQSPSVTATTSCATLGAFTDGSVTTSCDPATCTWERSGCYNGDTSACNLFNSQCYVGFLGGTTINACTVGGGNMTCTDCLDDPAACSHPAGTSPSFTGNGTGFNVPNTAYTAAVYGMAGNFTVTINVSTVSTTSGDTRLSGVSRNGTGDCELDADRWGLCTNAGCDVVCGESWSDPGNAWHMTDANRSWRYHSNGYVQNLRCQNRDVGQTSAEPNCAAPFDYQRVVSEWDVLQYNLRVYGLDRNLRRQSEALGDHGDALTWGQNLPLIEGTDQDCASFDIDVDVLPAFDPSGPGQYDTALAIDRSGSMSIASAKDPTVVRADLAESAALSVLQALSTEHVASSSVSYDAALTSFSDSTSVDANLTTLDSAGLSMLTAAISGRPAPNGATAVGDAIRTSYQEISGDDSRDRFIILVSDGFQNTGEDPVAATRDLMASDARLHVCPVYFGDDADQSEQLLDVAREGKCSLRITDPTTNDIVATMFEMGGERYGGSVVFSDLATVAGPTVPVISGFLSLIGGSSETVSSELVVSPEMSALKIMIADSGRELTGWVPPVVTLTPPGGGTPIVLDTASATYDEVGRGYRLYDVAVNGAGDAGVWDVQVTANGAAPTSPVTTRISMVADRSDAKCIVHVDERVADAGDAIDIQVRAAHTLPLDPETVSVKAAVIGPYYDGTIRRFPVTLTPDGFGQYRANFTAPADNGVYTVQALCEAEHAMTTTLETEGASQGPVPIKPVPGFRVQSSTSFVVTGGNFLCIKPNDCDNDGVPNSDEIPGDADGDGRPNEYEVDSDDDGIVDADEIGNDADGDGIDDSVDADMNNDGLPDLGYARCTWRTQGGQSTRSGKSQCLPSGTTTPSFTDGEYQITRGVTLDAEGTAYMVGRSWLFGQEALIAVDDSGSEVWRAALPGGASTIPEVLPGSRRVAIGSLNGEIRAFSVDDGSLDWEATLDDGVGGIVSRGNRMFATTHLGSVYALDPINGRTLWALESDLGFWSLPSLSPDGDTVYSTWNTILFAVDANTGVMKWWEQGLIGFSSPPSVGPDGAIYLGGTDAALYSYRPDGTFRWRHQLLGVVFGPPAVTESGMIYVGASDSGVHALFDDGLNPPTAAWSRPFFNFTSAGPSVTSDGTVYVGFFLNGKVIGLDGGTGATVWEESASGNVLSNIAIGEGRLIYATTSGTLYSY